MPGRYKMVRCDGTCSESSVHSEGKRSPVVLRAAAPRPAAGRSRDGLMRLEWSSIEDEGRTLLGNATAAGFCRHHRRCGHHGLHSSRTRTRGCYPDTGENRIPLTCTGWPAVRIPRRARARRPLGGGGLRAGCCRASSTGASPSSRGAGRGPRTGACASRAAR